MAKKCLIVKASKPAKYSDAAGESLQAVWPRPRVHAEVRGLPDLFPRAGVRRSAPRRYEVELVGAIPMQRSSARGTMRRTDA